MAALPEDQELVLQYHATRDPELREKIILRYVSLVHFVLGRLGISQSTSDHYDDVVSQGLLGLIEAVDRFDPAHGAQFSTYAILRIRGCILDHLRSLDWLSRSARHRTREIQTAAGQLWQKLGREPSDAELAAHTGLDPAMVQQALVDASLSIVSLDTMFEAGDDDENSLHEILSDDSQPDPASVFDEQELEVNVIDAIKALPEREQLVLSLYYHNELTLKEIGEVLQVSESRVCQLHARAILNLRTHLAAGRGKPSTGAEAYAPPLSKNYRVSQMAVSD